MTPRSPLRLAAVCTLMLAACGQDAPDADLNEGDAAPDVAAAPAAPAVRCAAPGSGMAAMDSLLAAVPDSARVIEQTEISADLGVDLSAMTHCPSGLYVQDLVAGTGEVVEVTDTVTVRYTGWVTGGQVFDATDPGETATFPLNALINGWKEGVPGMREGGTRRLVIPYPFAYGERARSEVIVPRSDLIFDIEVVGIGPAPADSAAGTGS